MWVTDALRSFVYLRRIARAAERQADALDRIAQVLTDEWARKHPVRGSAAVELDVMDIAAVNERWLKQRELDEVGEVLDEQPNTH